MLVDQLDRTIASLEIATIVSPEATSAASEENLEIAMVANLGSALLQAAASLGTHTIVNLEAVLHHLTESLDLDLAPITDSIKSF